MIIYPMLLYGDDHFLMLFCCDDHYLMLFCEIGDHYQNTVALSMYSGEALPDSFNVLQLAVKIVKSVII